MHGLCKVYGVEDFYLVTALFEHLSALDQYGAFRERSVKIENGKVTNNFQFRNSPFSHRHA